MNKYPNKFSLVVTLLLFGCVGEEPMIYETGSAWSKAVLDSRLYSMEDLRIPNPYFQIVNRAVKRADSLASDPAFLDVVRAKGEWSYVNDRIDGHTIATILQTSRSPERKRLIRPKLQFYTPPVAGRDVCGGWSWWELYRTASNGCRSGDTIYKSLERFPTNHVVLADFLLHEWLHVAGFGHDGNWNQCDRIKRNSVPAYVGCLSQAHPDPDKIASCSLACSASE